MVVVYNFFVTCLKCGTCMLNLCHIMLCIYLGTKDDQAPPLPPSIPSRGDRGKETETAPVTEGKGQSFAVESRVIVCNWLHK